MNNHRLLIGLLLIHGFAAAASEGARPNIIFRSGHGLRGCPSIFTGGAAKSLKRGEHIVLPEQDTPLANYWLTLMQSMGIPMDRFSHSTGTLGQLLV